jgi:hypothetical protein
MREFLRHLRQPAQTLRRFTYNKQHKFLAVDAKNFEGYLSYMTCRMYFVVRKLALLQQSKVIPAFNSA